jgi:PAP2 superfamily
VSRRCAKPSDLGVDAGAHTIHYHLIHAAMPSLHVGWVIWCGVVVARCAQRVWVRRLTVGYPVLVVLVVMSTANHYLLDAVAGLAVLVAGCGIARTAVRLGWLKPAPPTPIGT